MQPRCAQGVHVVPTRGRANPQANDVVSVDMNYAHTLRGSGTTPGSAVAAASPGPVVTSSTAAGNPQLEQSIKRAESYMGDKFWSQALDEYKQAGAINPNEPRVLQGQAMAHYMIGDFVEADESADKLLQEGSPLTVPMAHYHSMGTCTGKLTIQRGKLVFEGDKSDGFDVGPDGLAGIEVHKISKPIMANEQAPIWPVLEIRWRESGGKEKKYQMLPYMYSKQQSLGGRNFASAFPMDDSDLADFQKFENSMANLIKKNVK